MPSQACTAARTVAKRLHDWQASQSAVGEESLTDWMLFALSEQLPSVHYVKFTRIHEARKTGADWEWWFRLVDAWLGFRVQAKRVKVGEDNYGGLAYANKHGLQIEKLRSDAKANQLIAIYALYAPGTCGARPLCRQQATGVNCGVFLASASRLYSSLILPGRVAVTDAMLLAHANPMPCLFCCPFTGPNTRAGWERHLAAYLGEEVAQGAADQPVGWHVEPPPYVAMIVNRDFNGRGDANPDRWGAPHIDGVAVFDLRGA